MYGKNGGSERKHFFNVGGAGEWYPFMEWDATFLIVGG